MGPWLQEGQLNCIWASTIQLIPRRKPFSCAATGLWPAVYKLKYSPWQHEPKKIPTGKRCTGRLHPLSHCGSPADLEAKEDPLAQSVFSGRK